MLMQECNDDPEPTIARFTGSLGIRGVCPPPTMPFKIKEMPVVAFVWFFREVMRKGIAGANFGECWKS
jgi:hypothetical protein